MSQIIEILLFPIKLIIFGFIYFYKYVISPIIPKTCRFIPTCSKYAIQAIKEFGLIKGGALAIKRVLRCNPKSECGVDPVPNNIKGDIKWLI